MGCLAVGPCNGKHAWPALFGMELAGLEPATSWVRYRQIPISSATWRLVKRFDMWSVR